MVLKAWSRDLGTQRDIVFFISFPYECMKEFSSGYMTVILQKAKCRRH